MMNHCRVKPIYSLCRLFLVSVLLYSVTGCNIKGLTSGYKKLSAADRARILNADALEKYEIENGRIYEITGSTLRKFISTDTASLVYLWVPHCRGPRCYSLNTFISFAQKNNRKIYIVADAYEMLDIESQLGSTYPVFIIRAYNYGSNMRSHYRTDFVRELTNNDNPPNAVVYASNLFFRYNTLEKATLDLFK